MREKVIQREIFESKCYSTGVSDAMRKTSEEEACVGF